MRPFFMHFKSCDLFVMLFIYSGIFVMLFAAIFKSTSLNKGLTTINSSCMWKTSEMLINNMHGLILHFYWSKADIFVLHPEIDLHFWPCGSGVSPICSAQACFYHAFQCALVWNLSEHGFYISTEPCALSCACILRKQPVPMRWRPSPGLRINPEPE